MVVQAFVFNSQRNINVRVSEPRGSSSRHVTCVGSGGAVFAGWDVRDGKGKGKGEHLAVYRQSALTKFHPPPGRVVLPLAQTDSTTVEEGQHSEYHQARTLVFSPFTLALGSPLLATPPRAPIVQTRQPHFALFREQQEGAMSSSKSSAVQSPAALGASNGDATTTTTSACQSSSLGPSGHSPLKRSACVLTPRDTQHPQQYHRRPVAKKKTRRRRPTAPTTPPLSPPLPPPPTSRNPWLWTRLGMMALGAPRSRTR